MDSVGGKKYFFSTEGIILNTSKKSAPKLYLGADFFIF